MDSLQSPAVLGRTFGTMIPEKAEVIRQPLWERKTYTSGSTTSLSFFAAAVSDKSLGFVEKANAVSTPKKFLIKAIGVQIFPGTSPAENTTTLTGKMAAINDVYLLAMSKSYLRLEIGNKEYLSLGPIAVFNPGFGLSGFAAMHFTQNSAADRVNSAGWAQPGSPDGRDKWLLDPPLFLDSEQNFNLTLNWSAAQTLSANAEIAVYLDGQFIRTAQ